MREGTNERTPPRKLITTLLLHSRVKKLKSIKEMMSKFWELWRKIVVNHLSNIYKSFDRIYNIVVLTRKDCIRMYRVTCVAGCI